MSNQLLKLLAELGTDEFQPEFAATGKISGAALRVEVANFGPLANPLPMETAAELALIGAPAAFGLREKTLVDQHVRNSQKIPAEQLSLNWDLAARTELLQTIAQSFGLAGLEARAHELSIYGPGGFFKPHQDTEKHPGMVATLVIVWPSAHIGGELCIAHGESQERFVSQQLSLISRVPLGSRTSQGHSGNDLRWCAFFADCRHEVLPVVDGYRLALTFDLVVISPNTELQPPANAQITAELARYFADDLGSKPADSAPSERVSTAPLVIALEHEYSEHGLTWECLKGIDRLRVGQLLASADQLGLIAHLALAAIEEIWSARVEFQPEYRGRGAYYNRELDADDVEKGDLMESMLSLDYWVDRESKPSTGSLTLNSNQVLCLSETDERYLTDSEYEGYMGNYGETLQYWYRRAVLVLQSPAAYLRTRFKTDFAGALGDLLRLAERNDDSAKLQLHAQVAAAQGELLQRAENWQRQRRQQAEHLSEMQEPASIDPSTAAPLAPLFAPVFAQYAKLAIALGESELAQSLVQVFAINSFSPLDAESLAQLEASFGDERMQAWLASWADRISASVTCASAIWSADLTRFMQACDQAGVSTAWQNLTLQALLTKLYRCDELRACKTPIAQQADFAEHLLSVLELARAIKTVQRGAATNNDLLRDLFSHLLSNYSKTALVPIAKASLAEAQKFPTEQSFIAAITLALNSAIAAPARTADDYALRGILWTCACRDCMSVRDWAESATAIPIQIALAEARRAHIIRTLHDSATGVSSSVIKQGSPHKLRLQKPGNLHSSEDKQRVRWQAELMDLQLALHQAASAR
jgi:hypothetical protein